jgi:hypothetical protein
MLMDPSPTATTPASALPEVGTLTFLFTDVEGSTPLWERHEATMRAVAGRHDALLDAIITEHGGRRVRERGEGDSIFAVFSEPTAAVGAALAMARAVLAEPWPPETPIRVRMGLHTGGAQLRSGDYYGPVVNRCARIRGLGHGGTCCSRPSLPPWSGIRYRRGSACGRSAPICSRRPDVQGQTILTLRQLPASKCRLSCSGRQPAVCPRVAWTREASCTWWR